MKDVIVDQVRQVREELIEQYGGIDGYFKHCQDQERARVSRPKSKRTKRAAGSRRKTSKTHGSSGR
jgi:hypothetical protein